MLTRQALNLSHRALWQDALRREDRRNSSTAFSSAFLWHRHCPLMLAEAAGRFTIELNCRRRGRFFLYPVGNGELKPAIEALLEEGGSDFCLRYLEKEQMELLETLFPGVFAFEEDRDNADYLYSLASFATLSGKKLHGKRNFCNRFESAHQWEARALSADDFPVCLALFERWAEGREDSGDERDALSTAFLHWDTLGFEGALLCAEGEPIAFSMGERLNSDTFDIHFEKADGSIPGAYPMIARETARLLQFRHPELLYLNREEDMGLPSLRKAKEEWYPLELLMKYTATLK